MSIITGMRFPGCYRPCAASAAERRSHGTVHSYHQLQGTMADSHSRTDRMNRTDRARRRWSRRGVLRVLAAAGAAVVADELWWEPWRLMVERVSLGFPELPPGLDGLRVVQLSDLHRSHTVGEAEIARAVERA